MIFSEKETSVLKDLQTQEQVCMDHYNLCASVAKDQHLKNLFTQLANDEKQHLQSITKLIHGEMPQFEAVVTKAENYNPSATYNASSNQADFKHDELLCSDSIGNEKMVSTDYNTSLFKFADNDVRKLLNHIQTEEQQHAEMIFKYKQANGMAQC